MLTLFLQIALDVPLDKNFDYRWISSGAGAQPLQKGQLALVPFGKRKAIGIITEISEKTDIPEDKIRDVIELRPQLTPLSDKWMELCKFSANYYQRGFGEVALPALPKMLRSEKAVSLIRAQKKLAQQKSETNPQAAVQIQLNEEQKKAVSAVTQTKGFSAFMLHGITGSGKTEVYLNCAQYFLEQNTKSQILILVPEINLTPQLEQRLSRFDKFNVVTLHSGLSEGKRLQNWLAAHEGKARIVLGTRLSIFASLPDLSLIIVDEEHDLSYKQQDGLRYSARDLAVWRAQQLNIPIILGSATPSLETWHNAQTGRYKLLTLPARAIQDARLPAIRFIDLKQQKNIDGLSEALLQALNKNLQDKKQSIIFINRRGYAPILACEACGWHSKCTRCTTSMVWHKSDFALRCHYCGKQIRIPKACPDCGNPDLLGFGRGTQKIEETLSKHFPEARILRIDADAVRKKGSAQIAFEAVHSGEVDILVGTQMIGKGHDFKNLTLVGVLNADAALFSHDFRAEERLFSQLMQVAGRAGRNEDKSEVLIQTHYPNHPLYNALASHDYSGFAQTQLEQRAHAQMPPFKYQALLRAEAKNMNTVIEFLEQAKNFPQKNNVAINPPIPANIEKIMNNHRAQMLVESSSRPALQNFFKEWTPYLHSIKTRVKWTLEVDPMEI